MTDIPKIIPIAADHAGYNLKEFIKQQLTEKGFQIIDMGTYSAEPVDYPDVIHPLAAAINAGKYPIGIIMCGSGNGVAMTANKYPLVRCALCWNEELAQLARNHNNANILSLPARFISQEQALNIALTFLQSDFENGRHQKRIDKIPIH
ncbi:MAG: ribose 5-phosphate isomerase B [Bacteroidales bacterium]|jgi:ribose 5-phosphate isomerase B|nr:ribose 5-phosphate isomerase B [Bacteroidales bacterium]